jgi:hypothetical protein
MQIGYRHIFKMTCKPVACKAVHTAVPVCDVEAVSAGCCLWGKVLLTLFSAGNKRLRSFMPLKSVI